MGGALRPPPDYGSRLIGAGGTLLAFSTLADSGLEHYRASFRNPAMVAPLGASTLALVAGGLRIAGRSGGGIGRAANIVSMVTGVIGLGFHVWNISKQPGAPRVESFFHAAPLGAPAALVLSGTLGFLADRDAVVGNTRSAVSVGRIAAGTAAVGIFGTVAEAALLHFRGAFHDPFMWLPIAVPPFAGAVLAHGAITGRPSRAGEPALMLTAVLGLIGSAFHARGVARNMGGWRNWRQNLLAGPPIPAPPAFTGLAIAGLGALARMRGRK